MTDAKKIESTADLRRMLLNTIQGVAHGEIKAGDAKAICNLAQQVYNVTMLEVKVAAAKKNYGDDSIKPVDLR